MLPGDDAGHGALLIEAIKTGRLIPEQKDLEMLRKILGEETLPAKEEVDAYAQRVLLIGAPEERKQLATYLVKKYMERALA